MTKGKGPEIIVRGNPKPPKFIWEGKPKLTKKEESIWWGKEQERWVEGHEGLKGSSLLLSYSGQDKTTERSTHQSVVERC